MSVLGEIFHTRAALTRSILFLEGMPTLVGPTYSRELTTFSVSNWLFDFQFRDYFRAANSTKITLIAPCTCPQHKHSDNYYLARRSCPQLVISRKKQKFQASFRFYIPRTTFHLYAPFSPFVLSRLSEFFTIRRVQG